MNLTLLGPELVLVVAGLGLLLIDLAVPAARRHLLGYAAAALVAVLFLYSAASIPAGGTAARAFGGLFVLDGLAHYFKALFLLSGVVVLLLAADFLLTVSELAFRSTTCWFSLPLPACASRRPRTISR